MKLNLMRLKCEIKSYEIDYIDIKPHKIRSSETDYIDIKPHEIKSYEPISNRMIFNKLCF